MPSKPRASKGSPRVQSKTQYKTRPATVAPSKTAFKKTYQPKPEEKTRKTGRTAPAETSPKATRPKMTRKTTRSKATSATGTGAPEGAERLQKIIASAGITSRRKAEELMLQGRVTVNGKTITELGARADPSKDKIAVDGKLLSVSGPRVYVLLNKPKGYISSISDPEKRPVVVDLLKKLKGRVYPVGRLDYDAEGVLLLTNDGELSNRLIHPNFKVPKKYLVKVKDVPSKEDLEKLEKGVWLDDGRTMPAKARLVRETRENSWIELTVYEGRNRLVKRMCQAVGHPVAKLQRVEFAGIRLGAMKTGEWRFLTHAEVERLKSLEG